MPETLIEDEGRVLRANGQRFHAVWLHHNAGQPHAPLASPAGTVTLSAAQVEGDSVTVTFAPTGNTAQFALAWLKDHAYDTPKERSKGHMPAGSTPWGKGLQSALPTAPIGAVVAYEASQLSWLDAMRTYGFAKVTEAGAPDDAIAKLIALFDSAPDSQSIGLAPNTSPSTDAPYHEQPPGLKAVASLEPCQITLVDGFACAVRLAREDPEGFAALTAHSARFESPEEGAALRPIIDMSPEGTLRAIRHSPEALAPLTEVPFDAMETFYRAYQRFTELTSSPEMALHVPLASQEALLFDNTRVLHALPPQTTLKARYASKDALRAALARLEAMI